MEEDVHSGYFKKSKIKRATVKKNYNNYEEKETLEEVIQLPILGLPKRGITQEAAQIFGIRSAVSMEDGKTVTASYFPYYNKQGELVAFKKRDWTVPKEDTQNHFSVVGNLRINACMFGQQNISSGATKKLYCCEGEEDAVALHMALLESVKGTKYEGKIVPSVVSISMGTANAVESIAHNDDFVKSFSEIVLAFDNDTVTPAEKKKNILKGKEATEAVAGYLLSDNIYTIEYPFNCKDARECIVNGYIKELGKIASFSLIKYSPETVCSGLDSDLDELLTPLREGLMIDRYPELMKKIMGVRTGNELITYAAFSGVGKSTLSREIAWELVKANHTVGFIFLEEPLKKTQQSLMALELGVKLSEFRKNPLANHTKEQLEVAHKNVIANGRTYFLNHFGSMKVEKLMQQVKYLHHICGCTQIFIDHISMVVAGNESQNERKDIDMLYEELASFMTVNDCTIHAVMHLKRVEDTAPKQKEGEEPKAYWRMVKKEMLRGSAGAEQMSSIIIVLENEVLPDGRRGRVRSKVEKNREWSDLGVCDTMMMNDQGRLEVVPTTEEWIFEYYKQQETKNMTKEDIQQASSQSF